jgi:hypothetical protein
MALGAPGDFKSVSVTRLSGVTPHHHVAILCALDVIKLNGKILRRPPIEEHKDALANLLCKARHASLQQAL